MGPGDYHSSTMFRVSLQRTVLFPSDTVWRTLIDFPNVPTWEDGVLEVRQLTPGAAALGTELVARRVYGGRESEVACRIVDWQEGRSVTMAIEGGPVRSATISYAVADDGNDRSIVTYTSDVTLRQPLGLLTPLIRRQGMKLVAGNLERLEHRIAATSEPRS